MFEPQTYAILMLVGFFALLMLGVPVAVTLATADDIEAARDTARAAAQAMNIELRD